MTCFLIGLLPIIGLLFLAQYVGWKLNNWLFKDGYGLWDFPHFLVLIAVGGMMAVIALLLGAGAYHLGCWIRSAL